MENSPPGIQTIPSGGLPGAGDAFCLVGRNPFVVGGPCRSLTMDPDEATRSPSRDFVELAFSHPESNEIAAIAKTSPDRTTRRRFRRMSTLRCIFHSRRPKEKSAASGTLPVESGLRARSHGYGPRGRFDSGKRSIIRSTSSMTSSAVPCVLRGRQHSA